MCVAMWENNARLYAGMCGLLIKGGARLVNKAFEHQTHLNAVCERGKRCVHQISYTIHYIS